MSDYDALQRLQEHGVYAPSACAEPGDFQRDLATLVPVAKVEALDTAARAFAASCIGPILDEIADWATVDPPWDGTEDGPCECACVSCPAFTFVKMYEGEKMNAALAALSEEGEGT
jgi:hypothetical protein